MYEKVIAKWVNNLFYDVEDTNAAREQKEELRIHLMERVEDYMQRGLPFDEAFATARESLGDPEELTGGFERRKPVVVEDFDDDYGFNLNFRVSHMFMKLVSMSPFLYIILGVTQNRWMEWVPFDLPNWWLWGWVIIPVFGILSSGIGGYTLVSVAPFVYITIGIFHGGTWWLWGWVIIPIAGILFAGSSGKRRRKNKKRKKAKVRIHADMHDSVHKTIDEAVFGTIDGVVFGGSGDAESVREEQDEEFGRHN